ncbi:CPBP family intramembrane glutamic endopeptidase [Nicoliella lavandulae]|uniref:CPBP family intramembrane glutamic endopeptidase n=1 Tax=Nicoliella lavandulae TaxID=3082954 RepID=A0ABU8SKH2_9LACO
MTAVKNSFHYLSTKGLMVLKFIGFILIYQISSAILENAPATNNKAQYYQVLLYGVVAIAISIAFIVWRYRKQLKAHNPFHFKRRKFDENALIIFIILLISMIVIQVIWSSLIANHMISEPTNQKDVEAILKSAPLTNYIFAGVFAPIFEELIFRGIFFNYFFKLTNGIITRIIGIIVCGGIFGFMHTLTFDINWVFYSLLGVVLSTTYLIFKDIRYDTALHMINNLI